ncbi:hypothetical protein [Actinomadura sp. 21ATH]|uniref:hypothetical protein n=1 Tax=Actinomadura sp. 21ATH TaxID=1735444 RepID=UPI0035C00D1B
MSDGSREDAEFALAVTRYEEALKQEEDAKAALFAAAAAAVRAGSSPEDLAAKAPFSAAYIRRQVRELGVEPRPRGPRAAKKK